MQKSAAILLCAAAGSLAAVASTLEGQLPKEKLIVDPANELGSSAGCRRRTVGYDGLGQELNAVSQNARCFTYVALAPPCRRGYVWNARGSQVLSHYVPKYGPNMTFNAALQNGIIADARSKAQALTPPSNGRLYRLTFSHQCQGGGMGVTCEVRGQAHFGACGRAHD